MVPTRPSIVDRLSVAASTASDAVVPRPVRVVVDRTLVDLACASGGGVRPVADVLSVDPPAVDAWRSLGIPPTHRHRVVALAIWPHSAALAA